jgi:hypothetical protein
MKSGEQGKFRDQPFSAANISLTQPLARSKLVLVVNSLPRLDFFSASPFNDPSLGVREREQKGICIAEKDHGVANIYCKCLHLRLPIERERRKGSTRH